MSETAGSGNHINRTGIPPHVDRRPSIPTSRPKDRLEFGQGGKITAHITIGGDPVTIPFQNRDELDRRITKLSTPLPLDSPSAPDTEESIADARYSALEPGSSASDTQTQRKRRWWEKGPLARRERVVADISSESYEAAEQDTEEEVADPTQFDNVLVDVSKSLEVETQERIAKDRRPAEEITWIGESADEFTEKIFEELTNENNQSHMKELMLRDLKSEMNSMLRRSKDIGTLSQDANVRLIQNALYNLDFSSGSDSYRAYARAVLKRHVTGILLGGYTDPEEIIQSIPKIGASHEVSGVHFMSSIMYDVHARTYRKIFEEHGTEVPRVPEIAMTDLLVSSAGNPYDVRNTYNQQGNIIHTRFIPGWSIWIQSDYVAEHLREDLGVYEQTGEWVYARNPISPFPTPDHARKYLDSLQKSIDDHPERTKFFSSDTTAVAKIMNAETAKLISGVPEMQPQVRTRIDQAIDQFITENLVTQRDDRGIGLTTVQAHSLTRDIVEGLKTLIEDPTQSLPDGVVRGDVADEITNLTSQHDVLSEEEQRYLKAFLLTRYVAPYISHWQTMPANDLSEAASKVASPWFGSKLKYNQETAAETIQAFFAGAEPGDTQDHYHYRGERMRLSAQIAQRIFNLRTNEQSVETQESF